MTVKVKDPRKEFMSTENPGSSDEKRLQPTIENW